MKKTLNSSVLIVLALTFIVCLFSCTAPDNSDVWENAVYKENTELGNGAKVVTAEVTAAEKTVAFTIHTDKQTVGEALMEHGLIDGEQGPYGLYVKVVNGITADYDVDQSYWAFNINGEYAMTGVDSTPIAEGEVYQLVYTK